jgi:hypothetical protein
MNDMMRYPKVGDSDIEIVGQLASKTAEKTLEVIKQSCITNPLHEEEIRSLARTMAHTLYAQSGIARLASTLDPGLGKTSVALAFMFQAWKLGVFADRGLIFSTENAKSLADARRALLDWGMNPRAIASKGSASQHLSEIV